MPRQDILIEDEAFCNARYHLEASFLVGPERTKLNLMRHSADEEVALGADDLEPILLGRARDGLDVV